MTGTEVFKRTATYDRDMSQIRLHAPQWKLLLAFDGQRALSEIALSSGVPYPEAVTFAENFLKQDWIAEQPITLEEYLKRASASGNYSGGVIPPSVVVNEPGSKPASSSAPVAATSVKETPLAHSRGPMRLAGVVDYIVSLAETLALGQLLVYRVFLRVPPEILQSEDIVSIHLVDDTSLVRGEGLQKAISAAVQEVVKRALPDSIYAPA